MTKRILESAAAVFKVSSEIKIETLDGYDEQKVSERFESSSKFNNSKIESSCQRKVIKTDKVPHKMAINGFAEAIHLAYANHHGLALSPDDIFITFLQGISIHINQEPELHRSSVGLDHTEPGTKETIDVRRDNFTIGNPNNDWQGVFPEFSQKIADKVGDFHKLLSPKFSTSDSLSLAVASLTIMDIFKNYFEYTMTTMCGIPEIALLGTHNDWVELKEKVSKILNRVKGLDFWKKELVPVLDKFIIATASDNTPESDSFWSSLYKPSGGSGGPFIHGWINVFFPYLQNIEGFAPNPYLAWYEPPSMFSGLTYDKFPVGFTQTQFTWNYLSEIFNMVFVGGFLGAEKVSSSFVAPSLSWVVLHESKE